MCGIFAWAGKKPTDYNKPKLDILGIYNISRGKHSCGISTDGDIFIGVDSNKEFHDFLANSNYIPPSKYPVVIGHTRHATGGAHNVKNAHPFGFGKKDTGYEFIGVHNGKLHNETELAVRHNIEVKESETKNQITTFRDKIDSEILLEIVYKNKDYKVLEQYNGAAALVFVNTNKPNEVYFYHGSSIKSLSTYEVEEERPLFYWAESKNSLYVSSIAKSLYAIGASEGDVHSFEVNTVYKVTDGDISKAVKTSVNRDEAYSCFVSSHYAGRKKELAAPKDLFDDVDRPPYKRNNKYPKGGSKGVINCNFRSGDEDSLANIYDEVTLQKKEDYGSRVYFHKLRYWRNGHRITGVYLYIHHYGFFFIGNNLDQGRAYARAKQNCWFDPLQGLFVDTIVNIPLKDRVLATMPIKEAAGFPDSYFHYFYDGINVATSTDFVVCTTGATKFNYEALSICSKHPLIDISFIKKLPNGQGIVHNAELVTNQICPLGSEKIYHIVNGNLIKEIPFSGSYQKSVKSLNEAFEDIKVIEKDVKQKEIDANLVDQVLEENLLEKDIEFFFKEGLSKYSGFIKRLQSYKSNKRAEKAIDVLTHFLEDASKLISIESK